MNSCRGSFFISGKPEKGRKAMKSSYLFYESILKERGLTSYKVALETRIPQSCFSLWKLHAVVPKWSRMKRIAEFLSTPERPLTAEDFYQKDLESPGEGGDPHDDL